MEPPLIITPPPSPPPTPLPPEATLSTQERLRLAKRRRTAQLKRWAQEAIENGSVPGIRRRGRVYLHDFVVDRFTTTDKTRENG